MAVGRVFVNQLLPSLVFPVVSAAAAYIIFTHAYKSGTEAKLSVQCSSLGASRYSLSYTGIPVLDYQLCGLVACFHALMHPSHLPFNVDLLCGLAGIAAIPAIEASRQKRHGLLALHVVIMLIFQRVTAAVMLPWYWLIFITTGTAHLSGLGAKIEQSRAEAVLFSVIIGYIAPSFAMLVLDNPYATAIWQPFPLWMFIAQHVYSTIRRPSQNAQSGYLTVQATHLILFLLSAIPHIIYVGPIVAAGDSARLKALFVPSLAVPHENLSLQIGVLDFIQWDIIFVSVSTLLACLWTARSVTQFIVMIGWFAVAGVLFGPGAGLIGVFAWREAALNASLEDRNKLKQK